jgi:hypothetical protein
MLEKAVAHYHKLLADKSLAESSRATLDEGLESARLIFGGRRLSPYLRPHFVTETDWARVCRVCETLWRAIQKVKDRAVESDELLDELGITPIEREWVAIDPGYAEVSPTARLDSFLTDEAFSFVELNGESPAGIAYADAAYDIFQKLPVMQRFNENYHVRPLYGRRKMLDVLLHAYTEFLGRRPERNPTIAIVDLKDRPTVKEFELFRDFFETEGYQAKICSPDELEFAGDQLRAGDFPVDIVYKRLLVNEYIPVVEESPALLAAYRAGRVCMVNSFRSKLIHKKALFAVLTNERHARFFTDDERAVISSHVPWTRRVADVATNYGEEKINLLDFVSKNRHRLVLKPNDDYGGHGIWIGWNAEISEWDEAIDAALKDGDYLVQERVPTARETFPALTEGGEAFEFAEQLVDLDPLLFNGKVGSAFTRLSFSELANVSSGGGMVPTFIINEKTAG